ncbi:hypothetical protein [Ramlibacter alkalitolerans]|uniref:Uncharacterized protein n=1 Tax=Ramlibacter alkalitolerans TaxID=2039631 RepID=A0ABS1JUK2_9BURK|nr:hypothetical protein [Ramlibacter alkalitolerans]MBL0427836.1 hypothetical protein [Ramlibacter alkalitolerans]
MSAVPFPVEPRGDSRPLHPTDRAAAESLNLLLLALTDAYTETGMIGVLDVLYKTADTMRTIEIRIARQKGNEAEEHLYSEALGKLLAP